MKLAMSCITWKVLIKFGNLDAWEHWANNVTIECLDEYLF